MTEQNYEIVFYGKLVEGFLEQDTKQHVAQLFKTSVDQVERMFTGKRVVIRNKLDQETAQKYILAMRKRGAECQIEGMGAPGEKVDFSSQTPAVSSNISEPEPVSRASTEQVSAVAAAAKPSPSPENPSALAEGKVTKPSTSLQSVASKSGLKVAGDKVDEILSHTHFELGETGERLSEEHEELVLDLPGIKDITIAPAGSDLGLEKEELPVAIPDTSHLSLKP